MVPVFLGLDGSYFLPSKQIADILWSFGTLGKTYFFLVDCCYEYLPNKEFRSISKVGNMIKCHKCLLNDFFWYFFRSSDLQKHQFLFRDPLAIHPVVFLGGLVEVLWVAIRFKAVNDDEGFYWCLWKLDSSCLMSLDVTRSREHVWEFRRRCRGGKSTTFLGMIDLGDMIYICFYGAMRVHWTLWYVMYGKW